MKQPVTILKGSWAEVLGILHAHAKRVPFKSRFALENHMRTILRDNYKVFLAIQDANIVGYLLADSNNQVYVISGQTEDIKAQLAKEIKA